MKFNNVMNEVYKLHEEYEYSEFASTSTRDVRGLPKRAGKGKKDKIVRRVIKNPITYIGDIKI